MKTVGLVLFFLGLFITIANQIYPRVAVRRGGTTTMIPVFGGLFLGLGGFLGLGLPWYVSLALPFLDLGFWLLPLAILEVLRERNSE